jgi:hypothetical protein
MILVCNYRTSFAKFSSVGTSSSLETAKFAFPLFAPGIYFYLAFINLRFAHLSLKLPKFYLFRLLLNNLLAEMKSNPVSFFVNTVLISVVKIPDLKTSLPGSFKISSEKMQLWVQPSLSPLSKVIEPIPSSPYKILCVLSATNSLSFNQQLHDYLGHSLKEFTWIRGTATKLQFNKLKNVSLVGLQHCVNSSNDFYSTTNYDLPKYSGFPLDALCNFHGKVIGNSLQGDVDLIREPAFFPGYSHNPRNYYHFMIEILPRLLMWRHEHKEALPVVLPTETPWQIKELLTSLLRCPALELPPSHMHHFRELVIAQDFRFAKLVDVNDAPKENIFNSYANDIYKVKSIIECFANIAKSGISGKKLFLMRAPNKLRSPANQDQVAKIMADKYGFIPTSLEDLTISEQASLFGSARIIVSPHGASLTNLMFCKPSTAVITMTPVQTIHSVFWKHYAELFHLRYFDITGIGSKKPSVFFWPEKELVTLIDEILE